jgi:hypothetical protein
VLRWLLAITAACGDPSTVDSDTSVDSAVEADTEWEADTECEPDTEMDEEPWTGALIDSDSVSDDDEHLRGTNPAAWDTDGDGVSDYSEHLLGTDPLDPEG